PCAVPILRGLVVELGEHGRALGLVGAERHAALLRQLDEALATDEHWGRLRRFPDLDSALEWAEDRLLADRAPRAAREAVSLHDHELCRGLTETQLGRLRQHLRPEQFPAGAVVVRMGDPGDAAFLLMRGRVSIAIDGPRGRRRIATVSPGMVFGELAL